MSSGSERRLAKLEEAMKAGRAGIAVLTCRDGKQDQAVRDYLARIPEPEQPGLVVVVRRFTDGAGGDGSLR